MSFQLIVTIGDVGCGQPATRDYTCIVRGACAAFAAQLKARNPESFGRIAMPPHLQVFDVAVLVLRLCLGITMAAHGFNKFFAGGRLPGTAGWFDGMGMRPGWLHARVAAGSEVAAGLGLSIGFLTPVAAAGFVALMLVAGWTVHRGNGFFIVKQGWEYNVVLAVAAVVVAALGAGRFSVDASLLGGSWLAGWTAAAIALGLGLVGGAGQLALFYRPPAGSHVCQL
jgi:putative oxidoreductase